MPRPISYAVFCLKKKSNEEKARAKERIFSHLDFFFFFNDTATTEIYTLSLHDALPILRYEFSMNAIPLTSGWVDYGFRQSETMIVTDIS